MRPTDELDIKLAANRARSPKFPDVATLLERREQQRIKLAARLLLGLALAFAISSPYVDHPGFAVLGALFFGAGFCVCCWCAGSRHNPGGSHADPF